MVTTGLVFLILGTVFSVSQLALGIFQRETGAYLREFDAEGYLTSLDRLLGRASKLKTLRSDPGFYLLFLDEEENRGEEVIHQVKNGRLHTRYDRFSYETAWVADGEMVFRGAKRLARSENQVLLSDIKDVILQLHRSGSAGTPEGFEALEVVFVRTNGSRIGKLFPVGGRLDLDSREPYLFQEEMEPGD
jgi:hypothetical protein